MSRTITKTIPFALVLCTFVALVALAGCSPSSSPSTSSSSASTSTSSSAAASSASSAASTASAAASSDAQDVITVKLDFNAGTGYEWTYEPDVEGILDLVSETTISKSSDQSLSGGPLQESFTFRAVEPGEVTLTFDLVRSWEGESAETQVYSFRVTDDLQIILNPYKSNFDNEPEYGANA